MPEYASLANNYIVLEAVGQPSGLPPTISFVSFTQRLAGSYSVVETIRRHGGALILAETPFPTNSLTPCPLTDK